MNATGSAGPDRRHAALVGLAVAVTILSGWTTWLEVAGSPLSGFRMAELWVAVGDDLGAGPPGWVGVAWYLVPLAGAASALALTWPGPPRARPVHQPLGLLVLLVAVVVGVAGSTADATSVGFGTWLAGAAGCAQAVAGIVSAWTRR